MKRIVCLGGGPAGLYSAILFKKALPSAKVEVYERNRADDTFGWGVVFSDKTMAGFRGADPATHDAIVESFHHWDDIDVHFGGRRHPQRRSWLLRHRAASACSIFCRNARPRSASSNRSSTRWMPTADVGGRRSHRRRRRRQQRAARAPRGGVQARTSTCASAASSGSARTRTFAAFTFAFEQHRARLVPDPCLSVQQRSLHGDRRDARGDLEGARPRPVRHRGVDRILRAAVRAPTSAATGS